MKKRLVVGISGSSGAILGVRLLQALKGSEIETHLVLTPAARLTVEQETDYSVSDVLALAEVHYSPRDIGAAIASGSFQTLGMVIIPCSIKSLSAVANSYSDDLLARAADVTLKEGRPLLLVVRETPLHRGHLRLMDLAARAGAVIFPPMPAFYDRPQSIDEMVESLVGRVLRRMGIENALYKPWKGLAAQEPSELTSPLAAHNASDENPHGPFTASELWNLPALTLATADKEGSPHAAPVYFAASPDRRELFFFSSENSRHSLEATHRPLASAAIYPLVTGWTEIRGLQARGHISLVPPGPDWDRAWQLYLEKFPFVKDLKAIVAQNQLYRMRLIWVRLLDNQLGFGHQEEWTAHEP